MSNYDNATIYYLSGTGNTYRVATWAGETVEQQKIKIQISPFEKADPKTEIIHGEKTLLGLFLPTHGFTAPWMMIRFVLQLPKGRGTHAFVSATRGGTKFGKLILCLSNSESTRSDRIQQRFHLCRKYAPHQLWRSKKMPCFLHGGGNLGSSMITTNQTVKQRIE